MKYPSMTQGSVDLTQAAEDAIRRYCGWHVAPVVTETLRVDGTGSSNVILPTLQMTELISVTVQGRAVDLERVHWSNAGMLRLPFAVPNEYGALEVQLKHGFENASHIGALVADIKKRAEVMPAGITRKRVGDVSVDYASVDQSGLKLFASERSMLDPYRLEGRA